MWFSYLKDLVSWFIKDPLSNLSPPLLPCWDPWCWSGCCNQPFAISKSMVADWEVQWKNERFHKTSPALLFCRYLEKIDLAEDWRSTSFRRLALSDDFHLDSFSVHIDANYQRWLWFFVMIAWMYGEGWQSCEDAIMSKSLPVASQFVDFVIMKCMSWFTFLHLEKMELCFVLFCSFGNRSESFLFEWSTFLFLVLKHWHVKFLRWVRWLGEWWVGWTAKRITSSTCFLYISDKKGIFHFHFSDKIHIKRNFF